MLDMYEITSRLAPLPRHLVSPGYDGALQICAEYVPLEIHRYPSGAEVNGWVVPPSWRVLKALISKDGRVVYNGAWHPLGVIANSVPFRGRVPLAELKRHLHFSPRDEEAIPFHFRLQYRPWESDWGFCVPRRLFDALEDGEYSIELEVERLPGEMKVATCHVAGERPETIVLAAHLDHPGQANDDASGCSVGLALIETLRRRRNRFSYRFVMGPEMIGAEFYLYGLSAAERSQFRYGIFLEMLGTQNKLALQHSYEAGTLVDRAANHILSYRQPGFVKAPFKQLVSNDEIHWEAYGIPMVSISRSTGNAGEYPEYHTNKDNIKVIYPESLQEAYKELLSVLEVLEQNALVKRLFQGVIATSHPLIGLYSERLQPALHGEIGGKSLRRLMDLLPVIPDGRVTILDLAEECSIPFWQARDYLKLWENKGLIQLMPTDLSHREGSQ